MSELIKLTPELMTEIGNTIHKRTKEIETTYPDLVSKCDYDTRLAITAHVFEKILEHAKEGGSFRYLIYERLGFGPDAYLPLYQAGGMVISNEFNLTAPTHASPTPAPTDTPHKPCR